MISPTMIILEIVILRDRQYVKSGLTWFSIWIQMLIILLAKETYIL